MSFFRTNCRVQTPHQQLFFHFQIYLTGFWHVPWNNAGDSYNLLISDYLSPLYSSMLQWFKQVPRCSNSYCTWHLKGIWWIIFKLIKHTWRTHSSLWVWILHLGGAGNSSPLPGDWRVPHQLKRKMILMSTTCAQSQCLQALPTPVFSAQNDITDARVPRRFGVKHSVQHPTSSPCEEHPTLLRCTETSHAPGLKPRLHEPGTSHLQG